MYVPCGDWGRDFTLILLVVACWRTPTVSGGPACAVHACLCLCFGAACAADPSYLSGQYVVLDGGAKDLVTGLTMKAVPR